MALSIVNPFASRTLAGPQRVILSRAVLELPERSNVGQAPVQCGPSILATWRRL